MASTVATRLAQVCREAGRPIPTLSEDDYIDYCVTEAIVLKANKEDQMRQQEDELRRFRQGSLGSGDPVGVRRQEQR